MEQKHIDEIDESFLGEEFIDEDLVPDSYEKGSKANSKKAKKTAVKKADIKEKMDKKHKLSEDNFVDLTEEKEMEEAEDEEVMIMPVKETSKAKEAHKDIHKEMLHVDLKPKVESKSETSSMHTEAKTEFKAHDPWKEEEEDGFFKDASTWKAITGIAVILLLLSIFTQGFNFSDSQKGMELSLSEAEQKTVDYVNNQLLSPPFVAEVSSSVEEDGLYKVTLSIAGETVDSYLTKDGKLFFPQGFLMNEVVQGAEENVDEAVLEDVQAEGNSEESDSSASDVVDPETELDEVPEVAEEVVPDVEELSDTSSDTPESNVPAEPVAEDPVEEGSEEAVPAEEVPSETPSEAAEPVAEPEVAALGNKVSFTVEAKKWLFTPHKLMVKNGDTVELTIVPSGLDFTFAVPGLGGEQEVQGTTVVTFTLDQAGSFEFKCSSCEDWRGMSGTLVVE